MEIKTIEEYILQRIDKLETENERLKRDYKNNQEQIERLIESKQELEKQLNEKLSVAVEEKMKQKIQTFKAQETRYKNEINRLKNKIEFLKVNFEAMRPS